jgi:microcin C transport system substrate-binding protein
MRRAGMSLIWLAEFLCSQRAGSKAPARGWTSPRMTPFIGTGPYVLESYEVNQRLVYVRRDDYWGEAIPANIGRNNFDRIRVEYFADSAAAFEGFKGGLYTFRSENSSKQWATSYDFEAIEAGHVVKTELPDGNLAMAQAYVFNLRREKFQDRRVREALGNDV